MSIWSGDKLAQNKKVVSDFDIKNIEANSYSLHMGDYYFRTFSEQDGGPQTVKAVKDEESFIIPPGQFAYLLTRETVSIPKNAMAFISVRATIKLQGLIDISGFHVDPGYEGKLIFAVFNASPAAIHLFGGEPIFKIWFAGLDSKASNKFLFDGQVHNRINNNLTRGLSSEIRSLSSLFEKVEILEKDLNKKLAEQKPIIDNLTFIWRALIVGIVLSFAVWTYQVSSYYFLNKKVQVVEEDKVSDFNSTQNLSKKGGTEIKIFDDPDKMNNVELERGKAVSEDFPKVDAKAVKNLTNEDFVVLPNVH